MANVHGRAHVCGSSSVTDHSTVSGPSGVKRSTIRSWSLEPRYGVLSVKLVVSTTSVSPSQWPRASPMYCRILGASADRDRAG